ncbi:MAG: endolytic transglycosylase MltG [Fidelibacterota bacterium]
MTGTESIRIINKTTAILMGMIASGLTAFYGIVLLWPQENRFDQVEVTIPEGASLASIVRYLQDRQVVSNPKTFVMAVKTLGYETSIPAGTFTLNSADNNYAIVDQLVNGKPELTRLTLLEGWTLERSLQEISKTFSIPLEKLKQLAYDPQFARELKLPADNLEGFLFPNTYLFLKSSRPKDILTELVANYHRVMTDSLLAMAREKGLSELEVVTLASIIEGEAIYDSERPTISAVYHNRLHRRMRLQADPTIQYIIKDGPRRLLNRDLRIDSPYNTYLYRGLPPGPINSPGKESLLAAINPDTTQYLYFVARGDGYHTFSRTQAEHNRAKRKFQKIRRKVWYEKRQSLSNR